MREAPLSVLLGAVDPRGRRRHAGALAAVLFVASLAAVPVVLAQSGDGDHQDTVRLCHAVDGRYETAQGLETDFYGLIQRDHGEHDADIVPPFVIEDPRAGDPSSFPGRNWDERGQAIFNGDCVEPEPEPPPAPENKVVICHRTGNTSNPFTQISQPIGKDGTIGGHENHTGPIFPAPDWGDIIPPFEY